jgi:hypothetical protein
MTELPKLIKTKEILHPAVFNSGPRITRVEVYEFQGKRNEVRFWHDQAGNLIKVD